jgi:hypothetical protein
MIRVFISYSRHDKTMADYIAAELRRRDADVFVDYQKGAELSPGGARPNHWATDTAWSH